MKQHNYLWFALETTGLDPTQCAPLEFAAVLCADAMGDDFRIVDRYSVPLHYELQQDDDIDDYVMRLHTDNGLWQDAAASRLTPDDVDTVLANFAHAHCGGRVHSIMLAGSSAHFALDWCRIHFPQFSRYLSHQVFDVRTLRMFVDHWFGTINWTGWTVRRALPRIEADIADVKIARALCCG